MKKNIRKDFPWIVKHPNIIYFDNAATTLKPQSVINAINDYYINYANNTHNADSAIAYKTTQKIADARAKVATLFNAKDKNIVFTSGSTEGLNLIAFGLRKILKPSDEVIISKLEHASNLLPWIILNKEKKITLKYLEGNKLPTVNDFVKAITKKTKVISVAAASNIMGNHFDYVTLCKKVKKIRPDIIIVVDAAQYLPHTKMDVSCGVDFIACSAHKLLGPTGLGCVYMKDEWVKKLEPLKYGGGMNETIDMFDYVPSNGVEKFEGGTGPLAQIFGWDAAIDYLNNIGWNNITKHQHELKKYFVKRLKEVKNLEVYSLDTPFPIIFFNYKGVHAQDMASWLGIKGVICRAGLSCAKLSHYIVKTKAAVRLSLYIYNTKEEIDKFISIMKKFKKGDEIIL